MSDRNLVDWLAMSECKRVEWWAWQGSNLRPSGYEPPALTTELQAPLY